MNLPVTKLFEELVRQGHIQQSVDPTDMALPGAFESVPAITTYGTPNIPVHLGVHTSAELEQRSSRDFSLPSRT